VTKTTVLYNRLALIGMGLIGSSIARAARAQGVVREIVATADQHNQSAITYHFASRAGLIDAVRERHETPIAQHRQQLIARLPGPKERTTRQLVEAHIQPLATEMLRCAPSYWARLTEMLLADEPLWFGRGIEPSAHPGPQQQADSIQSELLELMVAHLRDLPESEAVARVALTVRFLNSGLARWEHDSEARVDDVTPLASFTLILTDLAVAMLDAPTSVELSQSYRAGRLSGQRAGGRDDGRSSGGGLLGGVVLDESGGPTDTARMPVLRARLDASPADPAAEPSAKPPP